MEVADLSNLLALGPSQSRRAISEAFQAAGIDRAGNGLAAKYRSHT